MQQILKRFETVTVIHGHTHQLLSKWDRNPVTVRASYLASNGAKDAPPATKLVPYGGE